MSITYKGVRDGGVQRDTSGKIRVTRKLLYYFDEGETSVQILAQSQIPSHGAAHPSLTYLQCSELQIESNNGRKRGDYEVSCIYSNDGSLSVDGSLSPWEQPLTGWYYGPVDNIVPMERYYVDGKSVTKPLLSSAGTPIGAMMNKPNQIMKFTWNVREFREEFTKEYSNSLNLGAECVAGVDVPDKCGLIKALSGKQLQVYDDDGSLKYSYYQCDVEIELKYINDADATLPGFAHLYIDKSKWFLENNQQKRIWTVDIVSGTGTSVTTTSYFGSEGAMKAKLYNSKASQTIGCQAHPVDEDQLLNGSGGILYPNGLPTTGTAPVYVPKDKNAYAQMARDWSSIGLPKYRGVSKATYTSV